MSREIDISAEGHPECKKKLTDELESMTEDGTLAVLLDHDLKPLYYQMKEEMEGEVRWDYVEQGGDEWKVLIGKRGDA